MTNTCFDRAMLIDDNAIDLFIGAKMLHKGGIAREVIKCEAASAALDYLNQNLNRPDRWPQIMFVDIYMPLMSGFDFMEKFADFPATLTSNVKTYIVSSSIDPGDIERAGRHPLVFAFHEKPINSDFLAALRA